VTKIGKIGKIGKKNNWGVVTPFRVFLKENLIECIDDHYLKCFYAKKC